MANDAKTQTRRNKKKDPERQERGRAAKQRMQDEGLLSADGLRYTYAGKVDAYIYVVAGSPRRLPEGMSLVKAGKARADKLTARLATHRKNGLPNVLLVLPYEASSARDVDADELLAVDIVKALGDAMPLAKKTRKLLKDGWTEAVLIPRGGEVAAAAAVLNRLSCSEL